jgi:hypothetical protein
MSRNEGQKAVLDRADSKFPLDDESQWIKFDYLKLRETLEAIVASMEASAQQADEPPSEREPDSTLRLVVSNDEPEDAEVPPSDGSEKLSA